MILYKGLLIYPISFFNSGYVRTRPIAPVAITEYGCGVNISYGDIKKRLEPVERTPKPIPDLSCQPGGPSSFFQRDPMNGNGGPGVYTPYRHRTDRPSDMWNMTLITSPVTVLAVNSIPGDGVKSRNLFSTVADFWHESGYEVEYSLALGADIMDAVKVIWQTDEIGIVDLVPHFERYPTTKVYSPLSDYELKIEQTLILDLQHDAVRNKILEDYKDCVKIF